jgi:TPR repeat protein
MNRFAASVVAVGFAVATLIPIERTAAQTEAPAPGRVEGTAPVPTPRKPTAQPKRTPSAPTQPPKAVAAPASEACATLNAVYRDLRPEASRGDATAQAAVGWMRLYGRGATYDPRDAAVWLERAADQGNNWAQYNLALLHRRGLGVAKDEAESVKWLEEAALNGHPVAQFELGRHYATGQGVTEDQREAARYFRLAAEQGHLEAQNEIGMRLSTGRGILPDTSEALRWLRTAAEKGHEGAQYRLGVVYANGYGLPQDYAEANRWFQLTADQGNAWAQFSLGFMYATGQGVPIDYTTAFTWFELAAAQEHSRAREVRDSIERAMRPEQVEAARTRAKEWQPKPDARAKETAEVHVSRGHPIEDARFETIRSVQVLLATLGYGKLNDGKKGPRTETVIKSYERAIGWSESGAITDGLLARLILEVDRACKG